MAHNTAQGLMAILITGTSGLLYYLPILWLAAVPTGLLIGRCAWGCRKYGKDKRMTQDEKWMQKAWMQAKVAAKKARCL
ncbi:MAG: hypothetical protein ACLUVV_00730 [Christensenellales bacterium]